MLLELAKGETKQYYTAHTANSELFEVYVKTNASALIEQKLYKI